MSFLYPSFLFALSAIAIPIIIHLFNFRKFTTVYFSNVKFLKEVSEKTKSESTLKHLLVLIARILAILFLVLAFAQPFFPAKNVNASVGNQIVSIFIDNSFSMETVNKNGTLLENAKKQALEIAVAYKPTDRFQILTNDFEARHQRLVSKDEFINLVNEIKISPASKPLSEIISRQTDILQQNDNQANSRQVSYIISDFQTSNTDFENIKNDTSITFNMVTVAATETSNISIDTCWFETPVRRFNEIEKLHIVVKNNSDKNLENNAIKLYINDAQKTPADFSIEKNSETEIVISYVLKESELNKSNITKNNTHLVHGRIELTDYPVTFDDKFYFSYEIAQTINVLSINPAQKESVYLNKLFSNDSTFIFKNKNEKNVDYSGFGKEQLIILNDLTTISSGLSQELKRFINQGGSVLLFPPDKAELTTYNDFLTSIKANTFLSFDTALTKVDKINLDNTIYSDVFDKKSFVAENLNLPIVNKHYVFSKNVLSAEERLLALQNGDVFLSMFPINKGKLYVCAAPLQTTNGNFAKHSLFVPTLYKIAISCGSSQPLSYTIQNNEAINIVGIQNGENVYHIKATSGNFDIVPETKTITNSTVLILHNQISNSGNYNLFSGNDLIGGVSFNFNRRESLTEYNDIIKLNDYITKYNYLNFNSIKKENKTLTTQITELEQGTKLWKICIILALLFLAAEVVLIRTLKA